MPNLPKTFILLLNWNGWRDTLECLESLRALDYPNFQIVICDNGSTDGSATRIADWLNENQISFLRLSRGDAEAYRLPLKERLIIIENGENLGFAGGNNVGLRFALAQDAKYVWLLNTDASVAPNALQKLVEQMEANPKAGQCGSTILYYYARDTVQVFGGGGFNFWTGESYQIGGYAPFQPPVSRKDVLRKLRYVMGASLLVSRRFLEEVGLMEEGYFLYCEEIDWALRGKNKFELDYAPDSIVYHKDGASVGNHQRELSDISVYYAVSSRVKLMRKFFPSRLFLVCLRLWFSVAVQILKRKPNKAKAIIAGMRYAFRNPIF
jgi:GT2 family glycosyltransferase